MANALYDLARQSFLSQSPALDWDTDTIKVALVNTVTPGTTPYTVNLATHQYLTDLGGSGVASAANGPIVQISGALASKTVTAGVADAADVTFTAVANFQSGSAIEALVVYKDTGTASTSPLIAYIDTATGLPVTPNGGDITVVWDNGSNKIFKL